ncbi:hypothetical protein HYPSUDRAFT_77748 [Hypholoma sublateritium FD-334 SS-4]|uniref:Uncharacterized protein n=1 Tax=Hypholoma sublateritium (strain FD-334 SS-4) TaxID=945553 RepID=A0A0D2NRS8_HYPSF|nr:hypothetical protein HYPSUDRAFT_77748 [Hypholoma sublateritium FD-334 SS-4]
MFQSHYTPQPSEYSFMGYSAPLFQSSNEPKSAQNYSPKFAPHASTLWNALGPVDPAPTTSFMGRTAAHSVPSPGVNRGNPASSSSQNGSWLPPSFTHSQDNSPASEPLTLLSTPPSTFWNDSLLLPTTFQSHYTPQLSEYSFMGYSTPLFQSSNEPKSAQNYSPKFAPHFSAPWNALEPVDPAPTTSFMGGTAAHPVPSPANCGYPASSSHNGSWPPPSLSHSQDSSPASESSTLLSTPPSAVWKESLLLPTDHHPEDPPPDRYRGDQSHAMWNAYQQSTIDHILLNDEGIVLKQNKFGLPTSAGQLYTSEIGAENDAPNALQVQSSNDDASRGAGKGKRKADNSPSADGSDPPLHKRARLPISEDHSVKGDQQACSTSGYQVEMHQDEYYTVSAPEKHAPALGQSGSRMTVKTDKEYTFYEHVGGVNSKGDASTRRRRMHDQDFFADTVEPLTSLTAPDAQESGGLNRWRWVHFFCI